MAVELHDMVSRQQQELHHLKQQLHPATLSPDVPRTSTSQRHSSVAAADVGRSPGHRQQQQQQQGSGLARSPLGSRYQHLRSMQSPVAPGSAAGVQGQEAHMLPAVTASAAALAAPPFGTMQQQQDQQHQRRLQGSLDSSASSHRPAQPVERLHADGTSPSAPPSAAAVAKAQQQWHSSERSTEGQAGPPPAPPPQLSQLQLALGDGVAIVTRSGRSTLGGTGTPPGRQAAVGLDDAALATAAADAVGKGLG